MWVVKYRNTSNGVDIKEYYDNSGEAFKAIDAFKLLHKNVSSMKVYLKWEAGK